MASLVTRIQAVLELKLQGCSKVFAHRFDHD